MENEGVRNLEFHQEIRKVFEKYGFPDFFYGAVDMLGEPHYGVIVGDEHNHDNTGRVFFIKGMLSEINQAIHGRPAARVPRGSL